MSRHLVDAEVLADVDDPGAQAGCGAGLGADVVGVEGWVGQVVLLHPVAAHHRHVVLVEGQQALQEGVHVAHILLARRPTQVLHLTHSFS